LIVLKLESIVSKWYGDSEKKLSQIIDACDKLGNSIIFIDEIDALAQNRENENGIHEVSKRILSVLLQRLEGFHGKANCILICATNRKEDLDKALLSRFDLMIKYDLPDLDTRKEIFYRYAKHFNDIATTNGSGKKGAKTAEKKTTAYEALASLSEGLSCRDIKEACEQAERICASRIVQEKYPADSSSSSSSKNKLSNNRVFILKENVDLPTLDDYTQCIQMKLQDHKIEGKFMPFSSI
jgi:SpoVK/Ycf46/Vps4 family AAA+-type ATPase